MRRPGFVSLDYTLHDLYNLDGGSASKIVLVFFPPFTENPRLGSGGPPRERFVYDSFWELGSRQHENSALDQQVLPQRYGYTAGKIPVIGIDSQKRGSYCASEHNDYSTSNLFRSFQKIHESQRPIGKIVRCFADITVPPEGRISVIAPSDNFSHLLHTIDPDIHYRLASKRGLAMSNLPMPKTMVVDPTWNADLVSDEAYFQTDIQRMVNCIDAHPVPYILKLPQTISGMGTFKVFNEKDKEALRARLCPWLQHMLRRINKSNQHLFPGSLVVQEFIRGSTMSLSIFVTKKGRAVFVTCSDQIFNEKGEWTGGTVSYKRQSSLEKEYSEVATKVAQFLHDNGYYGPAGADVLTDESGNKYVVDLNVRLTGTYHFGPLQGHFTQRGLWEAMMLKYYFLCSQEVFEKAFEEELQNGRVIIIGWAQDETKDRSYGAITLGAEDELSLQQLAQRIQSYESQE
ncbi:solid-state culture-specific ATP-grasp domain protein [Aspergillus pseudotamarii]|uniref:Solid-state culture-specific ATP-grasp domain protein n=1 Tax=Aspergillus pseudotamarii TaxID=132259 RepID=A0A5N6TBW9_ASPPS|nr:solid-state culture-specific ATP-grasp domain protein [Aspergillus pseudotamarii]KAE8143878.1 solid-state culture-specific ATP-grasp domain protein [Aspergillus pseudotamarii]